MHLASRVPVHPTFLAAYAVLFLYGENLSEVLLVDIVSPLRTALLGAAAMLAIAALVFRDLRRGAVVASAVVVAWYGFGHAAPFLAELGLDEPVQLGAWALAVTAAVAYAIRAGGSLPRTTGALNAVATILVVLSLVAIVPYEATRAARAAPPPQAGVVPVAGTANGRDVYYIVFDRYGSADAIERRFGITDNDLYGWLEGRGFQVAGDSHANYRATDFSLAATLNMTYLDRLTEEVGRTSGDRTPAREMITDHAVGRAFRTLGYRYIHVGSWFAATASNPNADENVTFGVDTEFESVLRDTTIVPALERLQGIEETGLTFRDRHREIALFQFRQLRRLATAPGPKFVFAHILLPHDPYVFRADGSAIAEDVSRRSDEAELYAGQLAFTNARIKEVVETLLGGPDESDPIVILQGDEGPLGCRNVDCPDETSRYLGFRFGILNAMYLPGVDAELPPTITSVNTFRFLFREAFGADVDPLPDRSFTWPDNEHIYDFREVTDRIPS